MRSKSVNRCGSSYSSDYHASAICPPLGLTELLVWNREVNLSLVGGSVKKRSDKYHIIERISACTRVRTFALTLRCPRSSACSRLTALAVSLACDILHAGLSTRRRLFAREVQGDAKFHRGAKAPETLLREA